MTDTIKRKNRQCNHKDKRTEICYQRGQGVKRRPYSITNQTTDYEFI